MKVVKMYLNRRLHSGHVYLQIFFAFFISIALWACSEEHEVKTERVSISVFEVSIPGSATLNDNVNIRVVAGAMNGCYSDIEVNLDRINEFEYNIVGTADFSYSIACPEVIVSKESVLEFKPNRPGIYTFHINKNLPGSWVETLEVR